MHGNIHCYILYLAIDETSGFYLRDKIYGSHIWSSHDIFIKVYGLGVWDLKQCI